jgi:hypothetical protein
MEHMEGEDFMEHMLEDTECIPVAGVAVTEGITFK